MIAGAPVMVGTVLSVAAIWVLAVLQGLLLRRDRDDPLNRRFIFGLRVTMLIFAGRILLDLTGFTPFGILVETGAALVPLAALLLTEGLLRRHAPRWIKGFVAGGAVIFCVAAFWYADTIDPWRSMALLGFQVAGLGLAGWLVLTREAASLSRGENAMVVRLGLSLFVVIPLAVGDFGMVYLGLPAQFSAIAVLVLCWLAVGLNRADWGQGATLRNLFLMMGMSVGTGALIAVLGGFGRDGILLSIALVVVAVFVVAIVQEARAVEREEQSVGLLRQIARERVEDPLALLAGLQGHPLVEGAAVLRGARLAGLDQQVLAAIFDRAPVLRRADQPQLGQAAAEHMAYLFEQYSATHVLAVQTLPPVLVALSMPSLATSPAAELELDVVQRMAALIAAAHPVSAE